MKRLIWLRPSCWAGRGRCWLTFRRLHSSAALHIGKPCWGFLSEIVLDFLNPLKFFWWVGESIMSATAKPTYFARVHCRTLQGPGVSILRQSHLLPRCSNTTECAARCTAVLQCTFVWDEGWYFDSCTNKIKMINRCDLMLQDLKHFKTVIMSS